MSIFGWTIPLKYYHLINTSKSLCVNFPEQHVNTLFRYLYIIVKATLKSTIKSINLWGSIFHLLVNKPHWKVLIYLYFVENQICACLCPFWVAIWWLFVSISHSGSAHCFPLIIFSAHVHLHIHPVIWWTSVRQWVTEPAGACFFPQPPADCFWQQRRATEWSETQREREDDRMRGE